MGAENFIKIFLNTYHFFESSYFNVVGTDTRAESMFLKEPPLTLHSIWTEINSQVQNNQSYNMKSHGCTLVNDLVDFSASTLIQLEVKEEIGMAPKLKDALWYFP